MNIRFQWDPYKAAANWQRHRVRFQEAIEAFFDPNAIENYDEEHADSEDRFRLIGMSHRRLLFVVYSEPTPGTVRIISARKAEQKQQRYYEQAN